MPSPPRSTRTWAAGRDTAAEGRRWVVDAYSPEDRLETARGARLAGRVQLRGGRDHALDAVGVQGTGQPEAGPAGLVGHATGPGRSWNQDQMWPGSGVGTNNRI